MQRRRFGPGAIGRAALVAIFFSCLASAQWNVQLSDASYVEQTDGTGYQTVQFAVTVTGAGYGDGTFPLGEGGIPGAEVQAYTDCNCDSQPSSLEMGGWDMYYEGETGEGSQLQFGVYFYIYTPTPPSPPPSPSQPSCQGPLCCTNAFNAPVAYYEYYDTAEYTVFVTEY